VLHEVFDPRRNGLTVLRLGLAALVLVAHTWPLGGFGAPPNLNGVDPGEVAVAGFFAISGFLVTESRMRSGARTFLLRRFLRIYPGYWVALVVIGAVFAPLQGGSMRAGLGYVVSNATTYIRQYSIPGTLDDAAFAPGGFAPWDGSLWTLCYEVACYLGLAALFSVRQLRDRRVVAALFLLCIPAAATAGHWVTLPTLVPLPTFALMFLGGAVLRMWAHRVPMQRVVFFLALAAMVTAAATGSFSLLAPIPLGYSLLWLSTRFSPPSWARSDDYSYGVYIYAFPLQQLLYQAGAHRLDVAGFVVASAVCVAPFAVASWWLVERPAMRVGRRRESLTGRASEGSRGSMSAATIDGRSRSARQLTSRGDGK
jgi:peptidoglycan/LPS O-acetylase OafA/YrhL